MPGIQEGVGTGKKWGWLLKEPQKKSSWWWKCSVSWLYQYQCLVVVLHYSFAGYYHWEKLGKGYTKFLYFIFYNCKWIYNYFKMKRLKTWIFTPHSKKRRQRNKQQQQKNPALCTVSLSVMTTPFFCCSSLKLCSHYFNTPHPICHPTFKRYEEFEEFSPLHCYCLIQAIISPRLFQ